MCVAAGLHCPFKQAFKMILFFSLSLLLIATLMGGFFLATADPLEVLAKNIPGTPGDDYPIFAQVPPTSFFCSGLTPGGYYADPATDCQGTIHILRNHFQGLKMVENVQKRSENAQNMFSKCPIKCPKQFGQK